MCTVPIYLKIEEYKDLVAIMNAIKDSIAKAETLIDDVNQLRDEEDKELSGCIDLLTEVKDKIASIDAVILNPEGM